MNKRTKFEFDKTAYKKTLDQFSKDEIVYYPEMTLFPKELAVIWQGDLAIRLCEDTLHEGQILYLKYWNYWVRAGVLADDRAGLFFPDYENPRPRIFNMIADIGVSTAPSDSEMHIWEKIRTVWAWLRSNVTNNGPEYATISTSGGWPSIDDYAAYYAAHGNLVWAACFSKAHLFASLLGRVGIPRWRIMSITAHHTENGAPPTASHVFVAVYVDGRWYYLDPTWVYAVPDLPPFSTICSVGLFDTVDYRHPFKGIPIPLSGFTRVPLLND